MTMTVKGDHMAHPTDPYHAHIYYDDATLPVAQRLHQEFKRMLASGSFPKLVLVGKMFDRGVGPHPKPQFEIHFLAAALPEIMALLRETGLTALVHPLTDDDLADHTSLAEWIGEPLPLDETVLDPPGHNQGVPRFGKDHF
jgi:aromatic ring-cleaving dioxygenase